MIQEGELKARVFVTLKPSVFDPQGRAIMEALHSLGYDQAADVRQGKYFLLDLNVPSVADAEKMAAEIADRVLANPVIESFKIEVADATIEVADATIDVDGAAK